MIKIPDNFVLWILLMLTLPEESYTAEDEYRIMVPSVYVAFSGDLRINYTIPSDISLPNAFIRLLTDIPEIPAAKREVTTMGIDVGHNTGSIIISCGLVELAGQYTLEMRMHLGGGILAKAVFTVKWPNFKLQIPETHTALTQPITLVLTSDALCKSRLERYSFKIELEYRRNSPENPEFYSEIPRVAYSNRDLDISKGVSEITYQCNVFDMKGSYRAVLKNSLNFNTSIVKSNIMAVSWSKIYKVDIFEESIYPCHGFLSVRYSQPECSGKKDKIRMYMLRRETTGSIAAPLQKSYVTERPADTGKSRIMFDCSLFTAVAAGYCFVYVSVASDGTVTEQHKYCISSHVDSVLPIDGEWSQWSLWGDCSVTCGQGKKSRFRLCNNPAPHDGGRFCVGEPFEWQPCGVPCPDAIPLTPLYSPKIDEKCACGCSIHVSNISGEIIGSGRCNGLSFWLISVKPHQIIKLSFSYFDLLKDRQWLKVRNGDSHKADLLALSDGSAILTEVLSTSNTILIEFMSKSDTADYHDSTSTSLTSSPSHLPHSLSHSIEIIHVHGFIAICSAIDRKNDSATSYTLNVPLSETHPTTMWQSTVTIVGIVLCVIIVIVVVAFALYHRIFHKRLHKYSMATQDESPTHMAKSTSMHSTPSHHSNISAGIEIDYDMERPLTRQSKKKDNGTGAFSSRKSSVSSNRSKSSNKIRFKTKSDIEPGGSPKPSSRQYTPLPSPCVQNDVIEEITKDDKCSLFNTSPLLNKKPRSPKIHPSPRIKKTSASRTPDTPVETKHDMLRRKRKQSESTKSDDVTPVNKPGDIRIVTGAAVVCTVEESPKVFSPSTPGTVTPKANSIPLANLHKYKERTKKDNMSDTNNVSDSINKPADKTGSIDKSDNEAVRKAGSGASDESSSPDKADKSNHQTTSFIRQPSSDVKPRRPTSLHESYTKSPSMPLLGAENSVSLNDVDRSNAPPFDRTKILPKPDGQSPKSPRNSKSSTPKSVHSSKSRLTLSPARSIHTPSEVASENLEMEYDDYIDYDDPLSYFEPEELEKLKWKGAEKIGKPKKVDDD